MKPLHLTGFLVLCGLFTSTQAQIFQNLLERPGVHLGHPGEPEYEILRNHPLPPLGPSYEIAFAGIPNETDWTLLIHQDDVKETWQIQLNGKRLGTLFLMEAPLWHALTLPPKSIHEGENFFKIIPPKTLDDIILGEIRLYPGTLKETLLHSRVQIQVLDEASKEPLPSRLTLTDTTGALIPLLNATEQPLALRPGVVYTPQGQADLWLPSGRHHLSVTRGFEYGRTTHEIHAHGEQTQRLSITLKPEVDTTGWISCDPHTHTYTYSRHGDATLQERIITLAGEGIEIPVATDHNILTDYQPMVDSLGLNPYLQPIIGAEITTQQAHFNAFPIQPGSRIPDFRIRHWPTLLNSIRETPGVQVTILNHPLNIHNGFQPFAATNFNARTGEILQHLDFSFNAIELLNSSAQQSDMQTVFEGWFGMLRAGYPVTGVGSSDGHDVSRYIIGQGRTYIRTPNDDPRTADILQICQTLNQGHATVSMGLFVDLTVNGRYEIGDLATDLADETTVRAQVRAPWWIQASEITLFLNGNPIRQTCLPEIHPNNQAQNTHTLEWNIPTPKQDAFLICLATGPGITEPSWAIPRPYQKSSTHWTPKVAGITNPIWLDGDRDRKITDKRIN